MTKQHKKQKGIPYFALLYVMLSMLLTAFLFTGCQKKVEPLPPEAFEKEDTEDGNKHSGTDNLTGHSKESQGISKPEKEETTKTDEENTGETNPEPDSNDQDLGQLSQTEVTIDQDKAAECIELINELRTGLGLPKYSTNSILTSVAETRARDMIEKGYYSHYYRSSDYPEYRYELDAMEEAGNEAAYFYWAGENIHKIAEARARGEVVTIAMDEWIASPDHYSNLTETDFTQVGVAFAYNPAEGVWYCVQVFGS